MIYARLNYSGRIGNMLFIVATGATHAKRLGVGFKCVVNSCREGYTEQFFDTIFKDIEFVYEVPEQIKVCKLLHFNYRELPTEDNICLDGWFQSEKYLDKELVYSLFRPTPQHREALLTKHPILREPDVTAIHVRRGDYLKLAAHFPVCNMSYFNRAIRQIGGHGKFLICSDDIAWCKQQFKGDRFYFMENSDELTDIYVQSLCANNIISNSTFSWWGAWLNENPSKRVIAPKNWLGPANRHHNTVDVVPQAWERVNNPMNFVQMLWVGKHYIDQCMLVAQRLLGRENK